MKQRIFQSMGAGVLVLLVSVMAVLPNTAFAQDVTDSIEIALKTVYLHEPLERAHMVVIIGKFDNRGGKGKLTLEPNICSLNDFGDFTACTEMAVRAYEVTFQLINIPDPSGKGRRLYEISGPPLANRLFLVVPKENCPGFCLVSKDRGGVKRVVTLEPFKSPAAITQKK
jgi:hypothetical protein